VVHSRYSTSNSKIRSKHIAKNGGCMQSKTGSNDISGKMYTKPDQNIKSFEDLPQLKDN
jgi:hypothetical protein